MVCGCCFVNQVVSAMKSNQMYSPICYNVYRHSFLRTSIYRPAPVRFYSLASFKPAAAFKYLKRNTFWHFMCQVSDAQYLKATLCPNSKLQFQHQCHVWLPITVSPCRRSENVFHPMTHIINKANKWGKDLSVRGNLLQ